VTVEADTTVFQSYRSGILDSKACGTNLDHAITAVGYGTENGVDFYIVRNSWGAGWGD
jgi:cathepsin L